MVFESDGSRACQVSVSSPRDSFLRFCRGLIPSPLVQSRSAAECPSPWNPRWGPHGVAAAVVQAAGGYGSENQELCREVGPRFERGSLDSTSHPGSVRHRRSPRGFGGWPPVASELVRDWGVSALLEAEGRSYPGRVVPTVPARDPARRVWASLCLDARLPGPDKTASELVRGPPIRSSLAVRGSWAARLREAGGLGKAWANRSGSRRSQGPFGE